jgi:hypothetical protein
LAVAVLFAACSSACSGMDTLTLHELREHKDKWTAENVKSYTMVLQMGGDRLERSEYQVRVEGGIVTSLKRNGKDVSPAQGQDYSMEGLFGILEQELTLAQNDPTKLGAPAGYKAYTMAGFAADGHLLKYRRSVGGGTNNSIDIEVQKFEPHGKPGV